MIHFIKFDRHQISCRFAMYAFLFQVLSNVVSCFLSEEILIYISGNLSLDVLYQLECFQSFL